MHQYSPLVSIIIPCYNVEGYIAECVNSALAQTYTNVELICVDNNSTDGTAKVLQELKNSFPQLILTREQKKGAPAARNKGLSLASGKWIQFLDADDLLLPNKIERQIQLANDHPSSRLIVGDAIYLSPENVRSEKKAHAENPWLALYRSELGNTCSNLFDKQTLEAVGGWNELQTSSQEYNLLFRLLKVVDLSEVVFDATLNTIIRTRETGSISKTDPEGNFVRFTVLRCQIVQYLKENEPIIFNAHRKYFYEELYNRIKVVAYSNKTLSRQLFRKTLPAAYAPSTSKHATPLFLWVNRTFGYSLALKLEKILNLFK